MKALILTALLLISFKAQAVVKVDLNPSNTVILSGSIDDVKIENLISAVVAKVLLSRGKMVYIVISSTGGYVSAANRFSEAVEDITNLTFICIDCESAAAGIFERTNHPRLMIKSGQLMLHEMWMIVTAKSATKANIYSLKSQSTEFNQLFADRLGWKLKRYEHKILKTEWYIKTNEAIKLQLADDIAEINCMGEYIKLLMPEVCKK
jgi:ATP-dependent protease ClpP protease subunit